MDRIVLEKMGERRRIRQVVDRNNLKLRMVLVNRAVNIPADPSKPVNPNFYSHIYPPFFLFHRPLRRARFLLLLELSPDQAKTINNSFCNLTVNRGSFPLEKRR